MTNTMTPRKRRKLTEEHRRKISKTLKSMMTEERRRIISETCKIVIKGKHTSPETQFKKGHPGYRSWLGKHLSDEMKKKISEHRTGIGHSEETRLKLSISHRGSKSSLYIDGRYARSNKYRDYRGEDWNIIRRQILIRDNWKCDFCDMGDCSGPLAVHHLEPYRENHNNELGNLISLCNFHHMTIEHNNQDSRWEGA